MKSYIEVQYLHLAGARKNYSIPFYSGVNIIYGDSDTGKSTVLEFINYLLGSSSIELADEVTSSVLYAALEIDMNGHPYTIKRNIFDAADLIEVYPCIFNEVGKFFPKKYSPNFKNESAPDGFFSDFLMDGLEFPKVKIKVAPTKIDSAVKRLGFRSIFKYAYLNQDDVGSKSFLDINNPSKAVSNREVFKYIFNVLDSSIAELDAEISEKHGESARILQKYKSISEFLRETGYESQEAMDQDIYDLDDDVAALEEELKKLNDKMSSDSENYKQLKSYFNEFSLNEKKISSEIEKTKNQTEKYFRLKNDYDNDIKKVNSIILAKTRIGEEDVGGSPCPICDNVIDVKNVEEKFQVNEVSTLNEELNSLKNRKKSIQRLIDELSGSYKELVANHRSISNDLAQCRSMMDTETEVMVTPYLTQRDSLVKKISAKYESKKHLINGLKIRNQQSKIYEQYQNLESSVANMRQRLNELKESAPKIDDVLSNLGDYFAKYLEDVNVKNRKQISISGKSFIPIIRGRDYYNITSGGLRTISSVGFLLSLLKYSIDNEINHPRLLMIDTVGKYLGKITKEKYFTETDSKEDLKEGISDPVKYQNIYECLLSVANSAEEKGEKCQIIVVDNDVPDSFINRLRAYIVAHYSSTGEDDLPVGLIDDFIGK